jgi:predicted RNA-binding protein with PIN domain
VVFDGYPDTQYSREDASSCLRVEFCRGRSADERIKDIIEQAAHPGNTVVVSDDKEIRFFIKAAGARALSVEEFLYPVLLRHRPSRQIEAPELTYSQKHKINQELKKLWLK